MRDFGNMHDDFDKRMAMAKKAGIAWFLFCAVSSIGLTGFGIWVIVKLMGYFGII